MFEIGILAVVVSFPVFYFYGIFQFLKRNNFEAQGREKIYRELQHAQSEAKTEKEKQAFQTSLDFLLKKQPGLQTTPITTPSIQQEETVPDAPVRTVDLQPQQSPFHSLENINVLLYLGAFLMIVACGIFATYSYASWTGIMKTSAMAAFALIFYVTGLIMYVKSKNVRPAAVVFTAIGLLAFPLVGVVAYNFWFLESLQLIWFMTSLGCVGLYILAYRVIRHTLLEYLTLFTALSLFQSTIGMFDVPVHFYYWGFAIFSLILTLVDKSLPKSTHSQPLRLSANIILPISIFLSVMEIPSTQSYFQAAVTCALATIFYALLSSFYEKSQERLLTLTAAGVLAPCSVVLFWMTTLPTAFRPEIGITLMVIALMYAQISEVFSWRKSVDEQNLFAVLSGALTAAACLFTWEFHLLSLCLLLISLGITSYLMYRTKLQILFLLVAFLLAFTPYEVTQLLPQYKQDFVISSFYLCTLVGFLATRMITLSLPEGKKLQFLGYGISLGGAFFFVIESAQSSSLMIIALISFISFLLIRLEKKPELTFLPFCFVYYLLMRGSDIYNLSLLNTGFCYLLTGVTIYLLSWINKDKHSDQLVLLGLAGTLLAFSTGSSEKSVIASAALLTGGGMIISEGFKKKQSNLYKIGAGVVLSGIQLFIYQILGVEELQIYTVSWAAYLAALSLTAKENEKDLYILLALVCATVPLGFEALESQVRGLILIAEGLALVFLGIQLKKKLVSQWGAGVLVLEVLYYMRDFLINLPSWSIFGGMGLALLAGSVFLLQRRKTED